MVDSLFVDMDKLVKSLLDMKEEGKWVETALLPKSFKEGDVLCLWRDVVYSEKEWDLMLSAIEECDRWILIEETTKLKIGMVDGERVKMVLG